VLLPALDALVVVVHGHRERLLRPLLADDVLVEDLEDLLRARQRAAGRLRLLLQLLADDVVAQLDAFVADEHARARDQLADLVLALPAERAVQDLAAVGSALTVFAHFPAYLLQPHWRPENSTAVRTPDRTGCTGWNSFRIRRLRPVRGRFRACPAALSRPGWCPRAGARAPRPRGRTRARPGRS